ncbi:condensation domain-containing protein, partial [Archangium sp.]|uniref:condensation domain-containing protein n=1 Tax=Archangium sp. TaxID=1872627 RepID=UPI002D40A7FF
MGIRAPWYTAASTIIEVLNERGAREAERSAFTFLGDADSDQSSLTYGDLDLRARRIATLLQRYVVRGERVVLLSPPGLDYVSGFLGCLYAGAIAVPAYPPEGDPVRLKRNLPRLRAIIHDAQASVVLTTASIRANVDLIFQYAPDLEALRWLTTDELPPGEEKAWRRPDVGSDVLSFLQYTSGSTGSPKGVMVSHGNLLHNLAQIERKWRTHRDSVSVFWLPPFHDLGLIGGILMPVFTGYHGVLMAPLTLLRRPFRWLEAITRFRGTFTACPNFAFDLCARKISPEERSQLDLRSWEVAVNAAEPIRAETLERFTKTFEPCGFRREMFFNAYGLAEATLELSTGGGEGPRLLSVDTAALEQQGRAVAAEPGQVGSRTVVSSGRFLPEQDALVVNPETREPCPPGMVGEVWARGPSMAQGYWNRPEETERTFRATLADGQGPYLRTGDLAFMHDAELYITGRLKDLIIIRGRNLYPQDIELTVEKSHPALRPGCGAAFSVDVAGEERLVVVNEVDSKRVPELSESVLQDIRRRVAEAHDIQLHALVLIETGHIPKTSSGKIQRRTCRAAFLSGELPVVLSWRESSLEEEGGSQVQDMEAPGAGASLESIAAWLRWLVARRLRMQWDTVNPAEPLKSYGLDSLFAVELAYEMERSLRVVLPMEVVLQGPSVTQLAERLHAAATGAAPSALVRRRAPASGVPLSAGQLGLWHLAQMEPDSPYYNVPIALHVEGPLDAPVLERSLNELVRRHESLRTTFQQGAEPCQVISPARTLQLGRKDLRHLPATAREAEVVKLAAEESLQLFDLAQGPLLRATLLWVRERESGLLLTVHHIVFDGWSAVVLFKELSVIYEAFTTGRLSPLPECPLQYSDYVAWQREWLTGKALDSQLAYWKQQLAGVPEVLELPTDHVRPAKRAYRGSSYAFVLPGELSESLRTLARQEGVTRFMVLLAAFQVLLHRYTGQEDFCVGAPCAGRNRADLEGLIGYFVNILVLRARLSGASSFRGLLAQVRSVAMEAYAHQDVPFERLVRELQPHRDEGRSPLVQVLIAAEQDVEPLLKLPGLKLRMLELESRTAKFDLVLYVTEKTQGDSLVLEYDAELFERETVARMAGHFQKLLEEVVARPEQRVMEAQLLTEAERRRVLVEWNDTRAEYPRERCVHELFEEQVERTPEAVAVQYEGMQLTYRELNRRANLLARRLMRLGVGPEVRVGVCLERSVEMVVALLGTLKAGGAYVPLEPSYPRERLAYMMGDARAPVLLTQERLLETLPEHTGQVVCLDSGWGDIEREG